MQAVSLPPPAPPCEGGVAPACDGVVPGGDGAAPGRGSSAWKCGLCVRVPESVFAGTRRHFGDQEIVESIFTIGCYMMMARLTEATETDLDPAAGMAVFDSGKKRSA